MKVQRPERNDDVTEASPLTHTASESPINGREKDSLNYWKPRFQVSTPQFSKNMPGLFKGTIMNPREGRNPCQFGEITGFPVGTRWKDRRDLCDDGIHAPTRGGIHGRGQEGVFSIVLSGGYEDDVDLGYEFTYTGQGGQLEWSKMQVRDQKWLLGNLALRTAWKLRKPVRVIRGSKLNSPYSPAEGYRYDGLYMVNAADMKEGKSGFKVCLFRLVRCPNQLPLPDAIARLPVVMPRAMPFNEITTSSGNASDVDALMLY